MRCFPDLFVPGGGGGDILPFLILAPDPWSINLMRLSVEEPKYECMSKGTSEHACSLVILGMIACTHSQSRVDLVSRSTPAVAGPSDGRRDRGCVWVWCLSPYVRACSHITQVAGTMIMLLSWWNSKYEMDGMYHRNFIKSGWSPAAVITICIFVSLSHNTLLAKKFVTPPLKTIKPMWIELLCFHLAEIGMIWTRDCSPTKSDTTLGRHSMQGQVGSSSSETTV